MIRFFKNVLPLHQTKKFIKNRYCANHASDKKSKLDKLLEIHQDKIIFNSYLERDLLEMGSHKFYIKLVKQAKEEKANKLEARQLSPLPLALKYMTGNQETAENVIIATKTSPKSQPVLQFPFKLSKNILVEENADPNYIQKFNSSEDCKEEFDRTDIKRWMTNYEHYDDTKLGNEIEKDEEEIVYDWCKDYGTPDASIGVSTVPCGGCGALLHCSEPSIPGYLPSEIFKGRTRDELKTIECQRCHFLKEYNIALDISVQPEEYEKLLQSIRNVKSLVVLMVDLLDFPCSIWPGILDIIGPDRPLIIVGNKVDLLPCDGEGYITRVKDSLISEINKTNLKNANIKHIQLISAKTGYGVEELISVMFKSWLYKGDVFLIGCTNVGKSSLFNALLQSDYCKVHAVDIIKRATVSKWPGTTLNLLKFPINRPSGWKLYERARRLKSQSRLMKMEKEIKEAQETGRVSSLPVSLIGHIGRTFNVPIDPVTEEPVRPVLDEKDKIFSNSKWFFDTPGVIHPDQVLGLLTTEELLIAIPKSTIRPQTYYVKCGQTLFIGGLARIDVVGAEHAFWLTVFCSSRLPVTVTRTEDAREVYDQFLGTEALAAPAGSAERLRQWPGLAEGPSFRFYGEGSKASCGDLVLSSVAWAAVATRGGAEVELRPWTPGARGIHRRHPSLLPLAVSSKGKRIRGTPAYSGG